MPAPLSLTARPTPATSPSDRQPSQAGAVRPGLLIGVVLATVLLLGGVWMLERAGPTPAGDALSAVPADATNVAFVSHPGRVLASLEGLARRVGYVRQVAGLEESLQRQLGFDVTDPEAWAERGVDPDRGLAAWGGPEGTVGVVPVSDADRFESALRSLLESRSQARPGPEREVDGHRVQTVESADGRLLAAWTRGDGVVLVSSGPGAVERVASGGRNPGPPEGLDRARKGLGVAPDLMLWLAEPPPGLTLSFPGPAALGLVVREDGLDLHTWAAAAEDGLAASLTGPAPTAEALRQLDPQASLAARASVDLPVLWRRLVATDRLPARAETLALRLKAAGVDLEADLLPLLGKTWLFDVGLVPAPDVTRLASLDPRRSNPFEYVQVGLRVPVRDPEALSQRLPQVAEALGPALGARVVAGEQAGHPVWTVRYRLGEGMTFGLVGDALLVTGGEGAFARAAGRLTEPEDPAAAEKFEVLTGDAPLAMVLHVPNLMTELRGLRSSSFGGGPSGVVMRSAFQRLASPLANLRPVVATAAPAEGGVAGRLELRLVPETAEGG